MNLPEIASDVAAQITAYLAGGGLFNPELAEHSKVRDLLIEAREQLAALAERAKKLEEALRKIANPANYGEDGCWDADSYPPEIALAALEKKP